MHHAQFVRASRRFGKGRVRTLDSRPAGEPAKKLVAVGELFAFGFDTAGGRRSRAGPGVLGELEIVRDRITIATCARNTRLIDAALRDGDRHGRRLGASGCEHCGMP